MANKKHEAGSLETLIGQDSIVRGEIISKGVVRLDGTLEGSIQADYLILGRSGSVKGDMAAREIVIDGTVEGDLQAEELVEINPDGAVEGNIRTAKLIITEGAFFSGTSFMERSRKVEKQQEEEAGEPDEPSREEEPSEEKKTLKRIFSFF
ncbi:MAG: Polymer-forming cytoskeletal [Syntrophorhabdus sp. PtaB.Bin184]|jgi:cytoskeletal protein CcmA (bactofilin family)|nr:MAG: Polymer-forming cytoskeletal [Syntrophorhabdus sp. PtaB.Bin184]